MNTQQPSNIKRISTRMLIALLVLALLLPACAPQPQPARIEEITFRMVASESSCINEQMKTFDQVLQEQGYGTLEESLALIQREPGKHMPLSAWPFAPGYLDLIEEWLTGLQP